MKKLQRRAAAALLIALALVVGLAVYLVRLYSTGGGTGRLQGRLWRRRQHDYECKTQFRIDRF